MREIITVWDHHGEQYRDEPALYWYPGNPLPQWLPPTRKGDYEDYYWTMIDFVNLARLLEPDPAPNPPHIVEQNAKWLLEWHKNLGPEIESARRGDIEPLRNRLPRLAEFLHLPPWPKGKRRTGGYPLLVDEEQVVDKVAEVNAIWAEFYKKKVRRLKPTTNEIVAELLNIGVDDVKRVLESSRRPELQAATREMISSWPYQEIPSAF